ncbi:lysylphosphatidylglycerol synthase domain-containing protein [Rhodanobacter ginsengisoli]|uniref:Lysylphosphatidylglycerol synthase domain-containing protein n=1 Tax=Rhodanobacter ginsengisoli TaxID=418646 RepID=A0ABW0QPU6_9GAMM
MNKLLRNSLRLLVLLATAGVFSYYLKNHPDLLKQLVRTPPHVVAVLVLLYLAWFGAMALTVQATLRICNCTLGVGENLLLNTYSTLVNFFVPGQGGVAVRGLYLKRRYQLGMRHFILATLIYYMSYAIGSAFMLLVSSRPWWQTTLGVTLVVMGSISIMYLYERRSGARTDALDMRFANFGFLFVATMILLIAQASIYAYELRSINPGVTLQQAVTYTGAANFSVFVALTPGAIGIRESFLFFSQKLHHVDTSTIMAANVLDRSIFLVFLGLLFIFSQGAHIKKSLDL